MAQMFPDVEVYGIDLSPCFPVVKPHNCTFSYGNFLWGLPYDDNSFDYIWIRYLYSEIKSSDWSTFIKEIKRVLKPGGIIEQHECDGLGRYYFTRFFILEQLYVENLENF